jgi:hypothetical protein
VHVVGACCWHELLVRVLGALWAKLLDGQYKLFTSLHFVAILFFGKT